MRCFGEECKNDCRDGLNGLYRSSDELLVKIFAARVVLMVLFLRGSDEVLMKIFAARVTAGMVSMACFWEVIWTRVGTLR